jgi:phage terminase small subunit
MTARNEKFIELYIQYVVLGQAPPGKRCSAAQAYVDAGYKSKNPDVDASKLLSNPSISIEVERRKKEILDKEKITTEKILHELANLGFSNIQDYLLYTEHGKVRFKKSRSLTRDQAAAIASVKVNKKDGSIELKFHDKVEALELLGRNRGAFPNKVAIGGDPDNPNSIPVVIISGEDKLED